MGIPVGAHGRLGLKSFSQTSAWLPQVDQPLCTDCCAKVQKEVEAALRETEREIEAYQAALRRLSAEEQTALPDEEFRRQMAAVEEEEDRERC